MRIFQRDFDRAEIAHIAPLPLPRLRVRNVRRDQIFLNHVTSGHIIQPWQHLKMLKRRPNNILSKKSDLNSPLIRHFRIIYHRFVKPNRENLHLFHGVNITERHNFIESFRVLIVKYKVVRGLHNEDFWNFVSV